MKRIDVAVGVIFNPDGEVLVGQRLVKDVYFEKWEFPGGKLELNESLEHALSRELMEELGIQVKQSELLMTHEYDYPDRHVRLTVFEVKDYSGEMMGKEGQALRWVRLDKLKDLDFLQGNQIIIERLMLGAD